MAAAAAVWGLATSNQGCQILSEIIFWNWHNFIISMFSAMMIQQSYRSRNIFLFMPFLATLNATSTLEHGTQRERERESTEMSFPLQFIRTTAARLRTIFFFPQMEIVEKRHHCVCVLYCIVKAYEFSFLRFCHFRFFLLSSSSRSLQQ